MIVNQYPIEFPVKSLFTDALCRNSLEITVQDYVANEGVYPDYKILEDYLNSYPIVRENLPNFVEYLNTKAKPYRFDYKGGAVDVKEYATGFCKYLGQVWYNYNKGAIFKDQAASGALSPLVNYTDDGDSVVYQNELAEQDQGGSYLDKVELMHYKEDLAYAFRYMHFLSIKYGVSILSYVVSEAQYFKSNPNKAIKYNQLVIYKYMQGDITSHTIDNHNLAVSNFYALASRDPVLIDIINVFKAACSKLNIDITKIRPLDYHRDFYLSVKVKTRTLHMLEHRADDISSTQNKDIGISVFRIYNNHKQSELSPILDTTSLSYYYSSWLSNKTAYPFNSLIPIDSILCNPCGEPIRKQHPCSDGQVTVEYLTIYGDVIWIQDRQINVKSYATGKVTTYALY